MTLFTWFAAHPTGSTEFFMRDSIGRVILLEPAHGRGKSVSVDLATLDPAGYDAAVQTALTRWTNGQFD